MKARRSNNFVFDLEHKRKCNFCDKSAVVLVNATNWIGRNRMALLCNEHRKDWENNILDI